MILNLLPPMQAAVGIVFTRFLAAVFTLEAQAQSIPSLAVPGNWS